MALHSGDAELQKYLKRKQFQIFLLLYFGFLLETNKLN